MSSISNYNELLAEQRRIESRIAFQKNAIEEDLLHVKEKLEPFLYLLPLLSVFKKERDNHTLIKIVTSLGIDVLGQKLLSKANWLMRLLLPLAFKKASQRVIEKL